MDRTMPVAHNEEIELYLRTYYSLLRSSEPIRIRSLEETHAAMNSTIHYQADSDELDVSALVYSALRLPDCIASTSLMVMGQMEEVFLRAGYDVESWQPVRARARRRKLFFDSQGATLAAFVSSVSDIDDLIPCIVSFQIEWNKLHTRLMRSNICQRLAQKASTDGYLPMDMLEELRLALALNSADLTKLCQMWPGPQLIENLRKAERSGLDIKVTVLGSGLSDYRRSVQFWWQKVAEGAASQQVTERPLYFVSSNTHSLVNLVAGYAWDYTEEISQFLRRENPEGLWEEYQRLPKNERAQLGNFYYYTLRLLQGHPLCPPDIAGKIQNRRREVGIARISNPHCLDVEAQVFDVKRMNPAYLDPRLNILAMKSGRCCARAMR
ncbi:MAG: hypothetical protein R2911_03980 [Caldilineaceae bacterium]